MSLFVLSASPAFAGGQATVSVYALADDGAAPVLMSDIASPENVTTYGLKVPLKAIAWRPVTGELQGFSNGMIAAIGPLSGEMTDPEAEFVENAVIGDGKRVAFDFNSTFDAVPAVTSARDNLVYFPEGFGDNEERAGSVRGLTSIAYAEGDAMAGTTPMIFPNAYTTAVKDMKAGDTLQYALEAETDALLSLANKAGTAETTAKITVDGVPVDLASIGGFDIVSTKEGEKMGLAVLRVQGAASAGLYGIDLETGAATTKADLGMGGIVGFTASLAMQAPSLQ